MSDTLQQAASILSADCEHSPDRLLAAFHKAEQIIRGRTPARYTDAAVRDFASGLARTGGGLFDGLHPQALEDTIYSRAPESPLTEKTIRWAWVAVSDDLARTGNRPVGGGTGRLETWAFTARSCPSTFVTSTSLADAADEFGSGQKVLVIRGPGRTSFLAALRRRLLNLHGPNVCVPSVVSGGIDACDEYLRTTLERQALPSDVAEVLAKLRFAEDYIGLFGRFGESQPVALLVDDAHLQSRAFLLGLPVFLEPSDKRHSLLVVSAPSDPQDDGVLAEVIRDASKRGMLKEIRLPAWDQNLAQRYAETFLTEEDATAYGRSVFDVVPQGRRESETLALATAYFEELNGLATQPSAKAEALRRPHPYGDVIPEHPLARAVMTVGALEGVSFHAFAVGHSFERTGEDIEDLIFDDDYEIDGRRIGGCVGIVDPEQTEWSRSKDGLEPVFRFRDPRIAFELITHLSPERRSVHARDLTENLIKAYGIEDVGCVLDRLMRLADGRPGLLRLQRFLLSRTEPQRVEAGFHRLLPVLGTETSYELALARLFSAAMEAGSFAIASGQTDLAERAFQAAGAAAKRLKRPGEAGEAMARLGEVRLALSQPEPARTAFDTAQRLLSRQNHLQSVRRIRLLQAEVDVLAGDLGEAVLRLKDAVSRLREEEDFGHAALGALRLGRILFEQGDGQAAMTQLDHAIEMASTGRDHRALGAALMAKAFVLGEWGDLPSSFDHIKKALTSFQTAGIPTMILEVAAAELQRKSGKPKEAEPRLRKVIEALSKSRATVQWADGALALGRALTDQGQFEEATELFSKVRDIRVRARDRFGLIRVLEAHGDALQKGGEPEAAVFFLTHARACAEAFRLQHHIGRLTEKCVLAEEGVGHLRDEERKALVAKGEREHERIEDEWSSSTIKNKAHDTLH